MTAAIHRMFFETHSFIFSPSSLPEFDSSNSRVIQYFRFLDHLRIHAMNSGYDRTPLNSAPLCVLIYYNRGALFLFAIIDRLICINGYLTN